MSIAEIYQRDPLSLTKEEVWQEVMELRQNRHRFNTSGTPAKSPARTKKPDELPNLEIEL